MKIADLLTSPDLRPWAKVIFLDLSLRVDAAGQVSDTQADIARRHATTRQTVKAALVELEAAGLLRPSFGGGIILTPLDGFSQRPSTEARPEATPEPPRAPGANQTHPDPLDDFFGDDFDAPVGHTHNVDEGEWGEDADLSDY